MAGKYAVDVARPDGASAPPLLPLRRGARLAVVGPMAVEQAGLLSDYADTAAIPGCGTACMQTIGGAIAAANGDAGLTSVVGGVAVDSSDKAGIAAALAAVEAADVAVLVLGITKTQEHEQAKMTID